MNWKDIPIEDRLISWAQNDEMVDGGYTQKGKDLMEASLWIKTRKLWDESKKVGGEQNAKVG